MEQENRQGIMAAPFALLWQVTMFLLPMQLVIRAWSSFFVTLILFATGLTGVLVIWYRNLPAGNAPVISEPVRDE
jgi:hypothetical protein